VASMNFDLYNALSADDKKPYQVERKCGCGEHLLSVNGHSTGPLHTMCPKCKSCPDCDEGE
jgi:hypothetical protein